MSPWTSGRLKIDDHETWADAKLQFDMRTFDLFQIMPRRWQETAAAIRRPALLITGDPDLGGLVTAAMAREAASLAPSLQIAHIPRDGHRTQRDQFDPFMALVRTFLNAQ